MQFWYGSMAAFGSQINGGGGAPHNTIIGGGTIYIGGGSFRGVEENKV